MNYRNLLMAFVVIALSMISGCLPTRKAEYDVVVRNMGKIEINDVRVQYNGFDFPFGVVPSEVSKRFSDYDGAFPAQAKITWRLPGPAYMADISEVIAVPAEKPALKNRYQQYELLFELDGKHVKAKYIVNDYTPDN